MTSGEEAVRRAQVPLIALHEMLMSELAEDIGRVTLAAPDPARGLLISDYLVSLVTTVEANIEQLLFHAKEHEQKCYAHETDFRAAARANARAGGVGFPPRRRGYGSQFPLRRGWWP